MKVDGGKIAEHTLYQQMDPDIASALPAPRTVWEAKLERLAQIGQRLIRSAQAKNAAQVSSSSARSIVDLSRFARPIVRGG